jgi:hypothetical protein
MGNSSGGRKKQKNSMPNNVVRKPFQSTKLESRCVPGEMGAADMERCV